MSYTDRDEERKALTPAQSKMAWVGAIVLFLLTAPFITKMIFVMLMPAPEEVAKTIVDHSIKKSDELMDRMGMPQAKDLRQISERRTGQRVYHSQISGGISAFPSSGAIIWGRQGQPIGGNLERLEIWDVTNTRQNKVVRVRDQIGMVFATVYLTPGQRISLKVPAERIYHITATAGDNWIGVNEWFGSSATTVDFGRVNVTSGNPGVIAMGAPDQPANIVPNGRF